MPKGRGFRGVKIDEAIAINIALIFDNEALGDYVLYEIPMGSKFVVLDAKTGFTVFAAIGETDNETGMNLCFIHSVFEYDPSVWEQSVIFVEAEVEGRFKVSESGEFIVNPSEMKTRTGSKKPPAK